MDRNLFTAIALSMGVYFVWYTFVQKPVPATGPQSQSESAAKNPASNGAWQDATAPAISNWRRDLESAKTLPPAKRVSWKVPLQLPQADVEIGHLGASIANYKYHGPLGLIELVEDPDGAMLATWPGLEFERSSTATGPETQEWTARAPSGVTIRKAFTFSPPGRMHRIRLTLSNSRQSPVDVPAWELVVGPGLGTVESERKENPGILRTIAMYPPQPGRTKGDLRVLKLDRPGFFSSRSTPPPTSLELPADGEWFAVDNRYFISTVVPPKDLFDRVRVEETKVRNERAPILMLVAKPRTLAPGESVSFDIPFYLGPKAYREIESFGIGLERSVDFGWFDAIGRVVLRVLEFVYKATGNYGWAIILLTLMIQALVFPLTYKSLKATAGMRKIQPEIAKLQQKYKEDPQRLNMEMMELYKSKGVNPMGGCLPMLVQMPVFVALYNTLRGAWELHGAPWILWVRDLSAQDPFYILPVTMGGIMFFQNKMNPAMTSDPAQAKMMMWMPVIFTFMFLKFPAGLVLYWLTNSLMGVVQQLAMRKRIS